ncbi:RNA polymerase sigma factor [Saccharothrix sp. Mg75]|uniref:RNA polymerase sigma factor n=1 Tax=Saccharothrix sp. Mg75 TaxID=3445357 RepID=UPI003EF00B55
MDSDELARVVARVVRRCQQAGMSRFEAEDCVHDAVLTLLTLLARDRADAGRDGTGGVESLDRWLGVVARHRSVDRVRRAQREQGALARLRAATPPPVDPDEVVVDRALAAWLVQALDDLPPTTRQVCRSIAAGATTGQTAAELGLTTRAVQSHLTRARRLLRHLAAGATAAVAGTVLRWVRQSTAAAAATAPVALTAVAISVTPLPHHGPVADPPPVAVHAPPVTVHAPPGTTTAPPAIPGPTPTATPPGAAEQSRTSPPTRDRATAPGPEPETTQDTAAPRARENTTPQPGTTPPTPSALAEARSSTPTDTAAPVPTSPVGPRPPIGARSPIGTDVPDARWPGTPRQESRTPDAPAAPHRDGIVAPSREPAVGGAGSTTRHETGQRRW